MDTTGIVIFVVVTVICISVIGMLYYIEKKIKKLECK